MLLFLGWLLEPEHRRMQDAEAIVDDMARTYLDEGSVGAALPSWTAITSQPVLWAPSTHGTASMGPLPALNAMSGFHFERVIVSPVVASFVPEQVVVADVTGDRLNDIVMTATTFGELVLRVHAQKGDGTLETPLEYRVPIYSGRGGSVEAVDLDNDGLPEIAMGTENAIMVFKRAGQTFIATSRSSPRRLLSLGGIDLDGDGHRDVFAQSWAEGAELFFSDGVGGFRGSRSLDTPLAGYNTLEIADYTGDGIPDVVITNAQGWSNVHVYPGIRTGGLGSRIDIALASTSTFPPEGMSVADMDRDGNPDLLVSDGGNVLKPAKGIHIHYQRDGNPQAGYRFIPFQGYYERPGAVQIADLDGNGYPDIVTMMNSNNQMGYVLQGPTGFAASIVVTTSDNPWYNSFYLDNSFAIGDVDSNGCPDVVLAEASSSLRVFYGRNCQLSDRVQSRPLPPRLQ
ncbi:hypothetical protein ASD77_13525 [Pseudoxanthomonas sp. Root65]|nr:hypothetical protein ASD77_13525 [Pseudoxanthomonas sp. Root65]